MKKSLLALFLLAALPALGLSAAASAAEGISYNYVEGGYVASNLHNGSNDIDADGGADASVALLPNFTSSAASMASSRTTSASSARASSTSCFRRAE